MSEKNQKKNTYLKEHSSYMFLFKRYFYTIIVSIFLHFLLLLCFLIQPNIINKQKKIEKYQNIKISFKVNNKRLEKKEDNLSKSFKIIEKKLKKTKAPKDTKYLGKQDHIAKKQQKNNKDIVSSTRNYNMSKQKNIKNKLADKFYREKNIKKKKKLLSNKEDLNLKVKPYKNFLEYSIENFQKNYVKDNEYVDDSSIEEGDRVDISTTNYKYIGYFSQLRRSIELSWRYPLEAAQRGQEGKVLVGFVIHKDGSISGLKILASSGFYILDRSVLDAIKVAAPFFPLPKSFGRNSLPISGAFNYVLGYFGSPY